MAMTASEMGKRSAERRFGTMTPEQKSQYFKDLQTKRKKKRGKNSK